ncbi:MAG: hypothetical protein J4G12_08210 [Gemmatimonadetes bacterium]|nr:hypothetical protein [Gemmatimonadota bacterium]
MRDQISKDDIMRFLDGEMTPEESGEFKARMAESTELKREVELYRKMREELRELPLRSKSRAASAWDKVGHRLERPVGWIFLIAGTVAWLSYSAYTFAASSADLFEKLSVAAIVIGSLTLLASIIYKRLRQWPRDQYRDVER